jgi:hypothetical protein
MAGYERTVDLMDESVFPRESLDKPKRNPNGTTVQRPPIVEQDNQAIVDYVVKEMQGTLGRSQ